MPGVCRDLDTRFEHWHVNKEVDLDRGMPGIFSITKMNFCLTCTCFFCYVVL